MFKRWNLLFVLVILAITVSLSSSIAVAQGPADGPVATVNIGSNTITWEPQVSNDGLVLTISGPDGFYFQEEFAAGSNPSFGYSSKADGSYGYELVTIAQVDSQVRQALESVTEENRYAVEQQLREAGKLPEPMTQTGAFFISGGTIITNDADEIDPDKDQQILDDLIVDGSACIGLDCVNGESFGFDTIRIKENNLRIKAQDTSNSASFPTNDWQLTFNDSSNGGQNKFSIDDIDGGRTPFTIDGAPSHSLYVEDGGRIGLGTSTPVVDLHIKSGNTPTTRLEQDGTSGFTPQTWDVAGNEANFFIRDVTNGSTLPFRIRPGAPTSALDIAGDGDIGIGTTSPAAKFHIENTGGDDVDDFVVNSDGNVGIGTASPDASLHVSDAAEVSVYIEAIAHTMAKGQNALVLVPEVSLTPQLVYRFRKAFGDEVTVMHSRLSIGERYDAWRLTREGKYRVVVGVRSAIFAPLDNLGIIIVDEEHEPSYKQSDQHPRFHARDVAVMRGWTESAVVVLGSATPSAESWHNAEQGKYKLIEMTKRIAGATMPEITLVDMIEARKMSAVKGSFSDDLLARLRSRREQSEGSIVFQNRRGYAMHIECGDCDYVPHCINCSITLTYHKDKQLLQCHYCGYTSRLPLNCPECGSKELHQQGSGTQRLEEELQELIPETRILRMDFDSTRRKGSHDLMLTSFAEDGADVLLGTQMVAKGLDFERVTLVGVVSAEQSLLLPDFRAEERTFQLLTQVSGRSGRGAHKGEVVLQSSQTAHQVFTHILEDDYRGFISIELERRKALFYPPFARVVLITFLDESDAKAAAASRVFASLIEHKADFFRMYPPQPAIIKRINRKYRYQVFCRVDKQKDPDGLRFETLLKAAEAEFHTRRESRGVFVSIDIDPYNLM